MLARGLKPAWLLRSVVRHDLQLSRRNVVGTGSFTWILVTDGPRRYALPGRQSSASQGQLSP